MQGFRIIKFSPFLRSCGRLYDVVMCICMPDFTSHTGTSFTETRPRGRCRWFRLAHGISLPFTESITSFNYIIHFLIYILISFLSIGFISLNFFFFSSCIWSLMSTSASVVRMVVIKWQLGQMKTSIPVIIRFQFFFYFFFVPFLLLLDSVSERRHMKMFSVSLRNNGSFVSRMENGRDSYIVDTCITWKKMCNRISSIHVCCVHVRVVTIRRWGWEAIKGAVNTKHE